MGSKGILRGVNIETEITPDPRGLGTFFFEAAKKFANKTAQVCSISGRSETFHTVRERSVRVAIEMCRRGIKEKDVVVLCSKNTLDSTIPWLATQYLGAITAALDPTLSVADTVHLLGIVRPKMLFISEESVPLIEESLKKLAFKCEIVVNGVSDRYSRLSDFEMPKKNEHCFEPIHVKNPHETAIIFFSSGTTGLPKGICISHFGIMYSVECSLHLGIDTTSLLHYSSLYWNTAVIILIWSYLTGGKRVVCGEFNGDAMAKIIQDHKVTFVFMAPGYTYKLNKNNTNYDTSSLKTMCLGGCPLSKEQLAKTRKLFPHSKVFMGYGMTEVSGFVSSFYDNDDPKFLESKMESAGKPIPGISLKFVKPDTEELLGANENGEIRVYTKALTLGYYNQESTGIVDSEGYLHSGDIGYYDEDGFVYVIDRIKEMLKFQSWHIVPTVLEGIIMEHPAVCEVTVFGTPHDEDGDHPTAAVVLKENYEGKIQPDEIERFVSERVLDRQRLRGGVYFVDKIHKTPTGKIKRREVRDFILNTKK